jgi:hypothetical protein
MMSKGLAIKTTPQQPGPCKGRAPCNPVVETAGFFYAQTNKANNVKFAHQSFGNPPIASLIKAINSGFLKEGLHLDAHSVQKYHFASPATSKGHMKQPCKGIWSARITKPTIDTQIDLLLLRPQRVEDHTLPGLNHLKPNNDVDNCTTYPPPHLIQDVFCFSAFAEKLLGVIYNDFTGDFPYMSRNGNVCFFVMYHYKTNAILITPIMGLDSECILEAYRSNFKYLVSKGLKPKVNVMDNQATKTIKAYLTPQQVMLQLVEPHNCWINATEQAIQTSKNRFIGTLGTTDSKFPIQLWDKLAPQVQDCINLFRRSCITPDKPAYETLEGPYNIKRYLLVPLGTRAIIYKDLDKQASWAPHGLDVWYLGPSKDHYRCQHYYVPKTRGYRISRSADLFPQHC